MQFASYRLCTSTCYQPHVHLPLLYYQPLTNNIIIQVHAITPAPPKVYHVTPKELNYLHAKIY